MTSPAEWEATPFFREFGVRVERAERGFARLAVSREAVRIRGARDGINGGVLATLAEAAMRVCLDASLEDGERVGPTRELTIDYLSAARGAMTRIDARMARKGRRRAVGTVEARDAQAGTLCAIAQFSCAVTSESDARA